MPLITIWNCPEFRADAAKHGHKDYPQYLGANNQWKLNFAAQLRTAALRAEVPGLDGPELITVAFASQRLPGDDDRTTVIIVELLNDLPERTQEIRQRLAEALQQTALPIIQEMTEEECVVEVAVKRFDPIKDGFCS